MGRWAQRHLRGGGSVGAAAPPPPPPSITLVQDAGGSAANVFFDGNITVDPGGVPDSAFQILGFGGPGVDVVSAVQTLPAVATVTFSGGWTIGDAWQLTGQPAWITTPITFPLAGTT